MYLTDKAKTYLYLLGILVFIGIVSGRAEFLLISLPFAIALCIPLINRKITAPHLETELEMHELVEGNPGKLMVNITSQNRNPLLILQHNWEIVNFGNQYYREFQLSIGDRDDRDIELNIPTDSGPGRYSAGKVTVSGFDTSAMLYYQTEIGSTQEMTVYPTINILENVSLINQPRLYHGNYTSHIRGEGLEFSEIKEYRHGDSLKHVNWKKSLKWGDLLVNDRYLDRNIDVVILIDSLTQVEGPKGNYLNIAARGAASLAQYYTQRKDRVGLINYDGTIDPILPQSGEAQLKKILTRLANLKKSYSFVARGARTIPRRVLPPQGVVYGFTCLSDERAYNVFLDLAARGFYLVLIYIDPLELADESGNSSNKYGSQPDDDQNDYQQLAGEIWGLKQESKISALKRLGAKVVRPKGNGVSYALSELIAENRSGPRASGGSYTRWGSGDVQ